MRFKKVSIFIRTGDNTSIPSSSLTRCALAASPCIPPTTTVNRTHSHARTHTHTRTHAHTHIRTRTLRWVVIFRLMPCSRTLRYRTLRSLLLAKQFPNENGSTAHNVDVNERFRHKQFLCKSPYHKTQLKRQDQGIRILCYQTGHNVIGSILLSPVWPRFWTQPGGC